MKQIFRCVRIGLRFKVKTIAICVAPLLSFQAVAEISESQAVQLGLKNPQIQAQWQAQLAKAKGEMQQAGRWENPSIEYSQENLNLPAGTSEETTIWLEQKFNIAGVKGLERKAAERSVEAREKQQSMDFRDWKFRLREDFYHTLAAQEKLALLKAVQLRLSAISDSVTQRTRRGDASQFDALRIEKERSVVESHYANAQALYTTLRHQLFFKIDLPPQSLEGRILPNASSIELVEKNTELHHYPEILAIDASLQSAELSAKAAGRERWPELTLGVGRIEVSDPDLTSDGNAISLGMTLPLFDNGGGEKRVAESSVRELRARKIMLVRELDGIYQSAVHALNTHQKAARQLQALNSDSEPSLSQLAEASYQAGELSVMELLDAYQSDLEASEQYIDSALQARLAYIQLQHLKGE